MAKIALELRRALDRRTANEEPGGTAARVLARGEGWSVADVVCTSGPQDRPFEEQHSHYSIGIVLAGTFQYRSTAGDALMTPGSLLLGNSGQCFECGHEHAQGDRCVSFWYSMDYFERLQADAGCKGRVDFAVPRIPPLSAMAPLVAAAGLGIIDPSRVPWDDLSVKVAGHAVTLASGLAGDYCSPKGAEARVTRIVRSIDRHIAPDFTLDTMARDAGLSPYHFLRTFERLAGVTPHQYIVRARLRNAAMQLLTERRKILDVAFDCGFGDVSNFNRAFRREFGLSPRTYRALYPNHGSLGSSIARANGG